MVPVSSQLFTSISSGQSSVDPQSIGLILLNQPLQQEILSTLWDLAGVRYCADGGLTRLIDATGKNAEKYIPDVVIGDFDSIPPATLERYTTLGTKVIRAPDQDIHDLEKAIKHMSLKAKSIKCILILGALGGRFDQEFANLNSLYKFSTQDQELVLLGLGNAVRFVPCGKSTFPVSKLEGPNCGLLPIGHEVKSVIKFTLCFSSVIFKIRGHNKRAEMGHDQSNIKNGWFGLNI
eukprot:m.27695 g.27695  ORF g.27695 m.27695 type:complete len:235 (-) comp7922_c0_seq1:1063-1767(-)